MRLSFLIVFPDGHEVALRTRRRIRLGDVLDICTGPIGYDLVKVIGLGWEAGRFAVNVVEVHP